MITKLKIESPDQFKTIEPVIVPVVEFQERMTEITDESHALNEMREELKQTYKRTKREDERALLQKEFTLLRLKIADQDIYRHEEECLALEQLQQLEMALSDDAPLETSL